MLAATGVLGINSILRKNPTQMLASWTDTIARILITRFLNQFISTGHLIILEDGGGVMNFRGTLGKGMPKVSIRVHNLTFYRKLATEADLGFADAYINGDFSLIDKNEGLFNLLTMFMKNTDFSRKRGWWTPELLTAVMGSAKYFYRHFLRRNSLTQARRNISRHYDMSNETFSLFLDETMTYSCAMFQSINEDLKDAQIRKMTILIEKAKVEKNHEVLDIGCGWGSFAIEVVRQTGCKYTGITLSVEQLKFAEERVKEAGLQDKISFLLCDYRQLPQTRKYDRIFSCEMIEHVGHEYMEQFFRCCDSALADDGIFVLQFISILDECYEEQRRSSGFMREYIFPGGCVPCLSSVVSAMAIASRFSVEHIENIGIHYYQTLRCWRKNLLEHEREILSLGFDEKFIRTYEYYFDYCAASFKLGILKDYQVIFSRPTFNNA